MFILGLIFLIVTLILLGIGITARKQWKAREEEVQKSGRGSNNEITGFWFKVAAGAAAVVTVILLVFSTTFTVDTGSSAVMKDWTGQVDENAVTTPGFHTKAPWQDDIIWNVRNQDVMYTGNGTTTHEGQTVTGAEIAFTDKDGVTGNLDIQVIYSIKPEKVVDLTKSYANQTDFEIKVVQNDVKSVPRDVLSGYSTVDTFEQRSELRKDIQDRLAQTWENKGVIVENVNIHGIRRSDEVNKRFTDAQNAQTDLLKAETEAKTAKAKAQGEADAAIAKANGEAEANRIIAASLTDPVLKQRWIDAIAKSGTIIVPQDFTSLGNLNPGK